MRDPSRIDNYIKRLKAIWKDSPDLRFGQLLSNLLGEVQRKTEKDLFYVEDDRFFDALEKCYREQYKFDDELFEKELKEYEDYEGTPEGQAFLELLSKYPEDKILGGKNANS